MRFHYQITRLCRVCRHFFVSLKKKKNPFSFNPRRANLKERGGGSMECVENPLQRFLWVSSYPSVATCWLAPHQMALSNSPTKQKKFGEIKKKWKELVFFCTQQHFVSWIFLRERSPDYKNKRHPKKEMEGWWSRLYSRERRRGSFGGGIGRKACVCVEFPKKSLNYACTRMPAGGRLRASLTSLFGLSPLLVRGPFLFSLEDAVGEKILLFPKWWSRKKTRKIPFPPKQIIRVHCQTGLPAESSHIVLFSVNDGLFPVCEQKSRLVYLFNRKV